MDTIKQKQTLREYLLTDTPTSRRHARYVALYSGWLTLKGNTMAMVGLGILVGLVVMAAFASLLSPHDPFVQDLAGRLQPMGSEGHILGTDSLGRDLLSRVIYGSQITLYIVAMVALIAPIVGLLVGTVAGYTGGVVDAILMRITDIFLAFPRLVLALAFVAALGAGIENAVLAISLTAWPPYARIARAETLTIRNSDYIAAVKLQGAGAMRIITKHIWPLCISSLIVRVTLDMAGVILAAAGLGFLGLGAQPPTPSWGRMMADAQTMVSFAPHLALIPGMAIILTVLGLNLMGDGLRDLLDPRLRVRRS